MAPMTQTRPDKPDNPGHVRPCLAGQTGQHPLGVSGLSGPAGDPEMGECWILFKPLASDIPAAVRYRHLLKAALRTWGLKAVRVTSQGPADARPDTDQGSAK